MLTREQVEKFEREVEERYREERAAIRIMRRLLGDSEPVSFREAEIAPAHTQASPVGPPSSSDSKPRTAVLPPLEDRLSTPTIMGTIEQVVKQFGGDEQWTMRRMLNYLRQSNYSLSEKPEGTISAALSKLAQQGKLKIVRQGAGSVPSIYQLMEQKEVTAPQPEEESAAN